MRLAFRAVILGLLALLTAACSHGRITAIWTDPGSEPSGYQHLMVLGVAANPTVRRAYEDNFVRALEAIDVRAHPGHALVPDTALARIAAIQAATSASGADGIIITHLLAEAAEGPETPLPTRDVEEADRQIATYYPRIYGQVSRPGYYADYRALRLETNLYDARRETLVWSGRSWPLDPSSEQTTISQVIADVIAQLRLDGFLP